MRKIDYDESAWLVMPGGEVRALRARVAKGFAERLLGLIGVAPVERGSALVFGRCVSIHTFWMTSAIDVLWLMRPDESGRMAVLRCDRKVGRGRVVEGPAGCWACAEMAPGEVGAGLPESLVVASTARARG